MKKIFLVIIFCFIFTSKVSAGPLAIIKPLVEAIQEFIGGLKFFPKSIDETTDSSIDKIIPQNSSKELVDDDISKNIVDETNETTSNAGVSETKEDSIDIKNKIALPAAGGFVYNENKKDKKTKEKVSSEIIKK